MRGVFPVDPCWKITFGFINQSSPSRAVIHIHGNNYIFTIFFASWQLTDFIQTGIPGFTGCHTTVNGNRAGIGYCTTGRRCEENLRYCAGTAPKKASIFIMIRVVFRVEHLYQTLDFILIGDAMSNAGCGYYCRQYGIGGTLCPANSIPEPGKGRLDKWRTRAVCPDGQDRRKAQETSASSPCSRRFMLLAVSDLNGDVDKFLVLVEQLPVGFHGLRIAGHDADDGGDATLFGALWPLGDVVKLDATVDRRVLRQQRDRLGDLGYEFAPLSQDWHLARV